MSQFRELRAAIKLIGINPPRLGGFFRASCRAVAWNPADDGVAKRTILSLMSQIPAQESSNAPPRAGPSLKLATTPSAPAPIITVRRLAPTDSLSELTGLLHRAYAKQMAMGLRPLAGRQDDAMTKKRVFSGECYVAIHHLARENSRTRQMMVGTILFHEIEESQGPAYFSKPDVASFSQFAVDPTYQGQGLGLMLLTEVENRTKETGAQEIACSMAEPDTELISFYFRRGYRMVGHHQWPYTNYRSAILSKTIA